MSDWDELQIARVFGVEIKWLHDIDKACDAFFKRRGMKTTSVREQICFERRVREQKRDARLRNAQ